MHPNFNKNWILILKKVFDKKKINNIVKEINLTTKLKSRKRDLNLVKGKINTFHALKKNSCI